MYILFRMQTEKDHTMKNNPFAFITAALNDERCSFNPPIKLLEVGR